MHQILVQILGLALSASTILAQSCGKHAGQGASHQHLRQSTLHEYSSTLSIMPPTPDMVQFPLQPDQPVRPMACSATSHQEFAMWVRPALAHSSQTSRHVKSAVPPTPRGSAQTAQTSSAMTSARCMCLQRQRMLHLNAAPATSPSSACKLRGREASFLLLPRVPAQPAAPMAMFPQTPAAIQARPNSPEHEDWI